MKNILKVVFVIIGTLIGAGFASGQEIYLFFFSYGIKGIISIFISNVLIGIIIYKALCLIDKYEIKTYKDFLDTLLFKPKIGDIINCVINIFVLITFFIMIAGFGAYFEQELGISSIIGSAILATLSFFIFLTSTKGVVRANEILVPILILILFIIGLINIFEIDISNLGDYIVRTNNSIYILGGIIYSSYNSILLIPVLVTLRSYLKDKKQIALISIISIIIALSLSLIIFFMLIKIDVDISNLEMPVVYVVSNMFKLLKFVYGFVILGSIFTTSISLGSSFLQNVSSNKTSYTQIAAIMCITSVLISKIGFSNLINLLYPVFGYLGLIQILKIVRIKT